MIDCEKLSCIIFFFCINIFPQVAKLIWVMDCSLFEGFKHVKKLVCLYLIRSCEWLLKIFILCGIPCFVIHNVGGPNKIHINIKTKQE
jgi:hypothetical protein